MPVLERAREVQGMDLKNLAAEDKGRVAIAKRQAAKLIPALREALYLEGGDGE